jgi:hypothetical protein
MARANAIQRSPRGGTCPIVSIRSSSSQFEPRVLALAQKGDADDDAVAAIGEQAQSRVVIAQVTPATRARTGSSAACRRGAAHAAGRRAWRRRAEARATCASGVSSARRSWMDNDGATGRGFGAAASASIASTTRACGGRLQAVRPDERLDERAALRLVVGAVQRPGKLRDVLVERGRRRSTGRR